MKISIISRHWRHGVTEDSLMKGTRVKHACEGFKN